MLLLCELFITPKMNEDDIRHLPKTSKPEPPILQAEWMLFTSKKNPQKGNIVLQNLWQTEVRAS